MSDDRITENKKSIFSVVRDLFSRFYSYVIIAIPLIALSKLFNSLPFLYFLHSIHLSIKEYTGGSGLQRSQEEVASLLWEWKRVFVSLALIFLSFILQKLSQPLRDRFYQKATDYLRNKVDEKFLKLDFRNKIEKKIDPHILSQFDTQKISEVLWIFVEHFSLIVCFLLATYLFSDGFFPFLLKFVGSKWIIFLSLVFPFSIYYLSVLVSKFTTRKNRLMREEIYLKEKTTVDGILIEKMGLSQSFFVRMKENKNALEKANSSSSKLLFLSNFLSSLFPLSLLLVYSLVYIDLFSLFNLFNSSVAVSYIDILREIDYVFIFPPVLALTPSLVSSFSDSIVNLVSLQYHLGNLGDFLSLPEKNENLNGYRLSDEKIASVNLVNIDFKYLSNSPLVIDNYSRTFSGLQLNRLSGPNGSGKSTLIYLILGIIKPLKGAVIVRLHDGREFDLNKDVNLVDWKENVTLFLSYQNLLEENEGSSGQRQLASISQQITAKQSAQIFLFDEATNSLDKENKENFMNNVQSLVSNGKVVVVVDHSSFPYPIEE